jgi:hypothetical protein
MESCKEHWALFFEDSLDKFKGRYNKQLCHDDYVKYCEKSKYQPFSKKAFNMRLKYSLADEHKTTKNKKIYEYFTLKESVRLKYEEYYNNMNEEEDT